MDPTLRHRIAADWLCSDSAANRNSNSSGHIVTIEDPVEYMHHHKTAMVNQREVGNDVPSMLENDLALEHSVAGSLKDAISLCEKERDFQTRQVLDRLLEDTEMDHAYWLEQQLGLIERMGLENYLLSQTGD